MNITIQASFLPHGDPTGEPGTSIFLYQPAATPGITEDERRVIRGRLPGLQRRRGDLQLTL